MSTNTLNDLQLNDEKNIRIATGFGKDPMGLDGNEYDYVLSFFKKAMKDPTAAETFTQQIYQVAIMADIPPTEILQTMKGKTGLELNPTLSYYLNGVRSSATLLGVQNIVKPNFYAGRNALI